MLNNNFTALRLVLALLVVLGHFRTLPGLPVESMLFSCADFAIDAFFVISGYLIYASFDKQPDARSFYIRRIFRIYPLYAVTVLVSGVAMAVIAGGMAEHLHGMLRYIGLNLIMANFLAYDVNGLLKGLHNPGINPSLWTLKIEVGFYLILPALWHLVRKWGNRGIGALYVASVLYVILTLHYEAPSLARQLPGQLRFFLVGIIFYRNRHRIKMPVWVAVISALALVALCPQLKHWPLMVALYPFCIGLFVFICVLLLPAYPLRLDISYGVYLFHGPLIQFSLLLGAFQDTNGFLLLLLACVCALALIAERTIERPCIAIGRRISAMWLNRSKAGRTL